MAVNAKDEIAVTDCLNHRAQIVNSDGNYLRSFGQQGSNAGEFKFPRGITFSKNENVFVADNVNHRSRFSVSKVCTWVCLVGKESLDIQLYNTLGLSVDGDSNVIVSDTGNKLMGSALLLFLSTVFRLIYIS